MSGSRGSGFTIIELMLFLAVSGALVVGIMTGAGAAVNFQRYKDASNSLLNYIQGQYDRVANVQNEHDEFLTCSSAGLAIAGTAATKGSSLTCYILGRLLTVSDNGKKVSSQVVYSANDIRTGDDMSALSAASLFTSTSTESEDIYVPEWSTAIVPPHLSSPTMDGWRLLIVRSPSTGTIRTFTTTDGSLTSLQAIVDNSAVTRADVTICVDPRGLTVGAWSGVKIVKDAASMSGVKMTSKGEC